MFGMDKYSCVFSSLLFCSPLHDCTKPIPLHYNLPHCKQPGHFLLQWQPCQDMTLPSFQQESTFVLLVTLRLPPLPHLDLVSDFRLEFKYTSNTICLRFGTELNMQQSLEWHPWLHIPQRFLILVGSGNSPWKNRQQLWHHTWALCLKWERLFPECWLTGIFDTHEVAHCHSMLQEALIFMFHELKKITFPWLTGYK